MNYKVVLRTYNGHGGLVSMSVYGKAETTYLVGKWVTAPDWLADKGYHLLVFSSLYAAKLFASGWAGSDWVEIYECECEEEVVPIPPQMWISAISAGEFVPESITGSGWLEDTKMYKRIKLTKRIPY